MEAVLLVRERRDHLVRRHLPSGAVEPSKHGNCAIEIRLPDVDQWKLVVAECARQTIRLLQPLHPFALILRLLNDVATRVEEAGRVEQAPNRKVLRLQSGLRGAHEFCRIKVAVNSPVQIVENRPPDVICIKSEAERSHQRRDPLLTVQQITDRPLRTLTDLHWSNRRPRFNFVVRVPHEYGADRKSTEDAVEKTVKIALSPYEGSLELRNANPSGNDPLNELA